MTGSEVKCAQDRRNEMRIKSERKGDGGVERKKHSKKRVKSGEVTCRQKKGR